MTLASNHLIISFLTTSCIREFILLLVLNTMIIIIFKSEGSLLIDQILYKLHRHFLQSSINGTLTESYFNIVVNLRYFPSSFFLITNLYENGGGGLGMGTTFWVTSSSFFVALLDTRETSISSSSLSTTISTSDGL